MNNLQIGARVRVKVGDSQGKTGVVYADLRTHGREYPWHVQIDEAGETGRIAYAEDELEVVQPTNKRYEVTVREVSGKAEQCGICDRYFEWGQDLRLQTFVCPVCNRECCMDCKPYEWPVTHFPNRYICDECDELPVEDQLRIAAFTAELNK